MGEGRKEEEELRRGERQIDREMETVMEGMRVPEREKEREETELDRKREK